MATISCRELTGLDLTTEEGVARLMNSETSQTICFNSVGTAYRIAVNLLNEG